MEHSLRDRLRDDPISASGEELRRYLIATLGDRRTEILRALFLDSGNRLLSDEAIAEGGTSGATAPIRTILNRALDLQAAALIMVHNHPGGNAKPSAADLRFTRKLSEAAALLGVALHDHVIVVGSECISLRRQGGFT